MIEQHFSVEFFPPRTPEGADKLRAVRAQLAVLKPEYFSVTFGAGGSTQQGTIDTVTEICNEGLAAAPHISCLGSSRESVREMLALYQQQGIKRLVALRGDVPNDQHLLHSSDNQFLYANELVEFIRAETGDWFHIDVAAYPEMHPQAISLQTDTENFLRKMRAGANAAITQYFFNVDAYFRFVEQVRAMGVETPIIPGIMPIMNYTQLVRFSEMCGAEIPRWLRLKLADFGDDRQSLQAFGLDVVTQLCQQLLDGGAPGLHFYTLNQAAPTVSILDRLS